MTTRWANAETDAVYVLLEREDMRDAVEQITKAWDETGLVVTALADELEKLVKKHLEKYQIEIPLAQVDWGQLAEHYALEIAGVDEAEDERRHEAMRQMLDGNKSD